MAKKGMKIGLALAAGAGAAAILAKQASKETVSNSSMSSVDKDYRNTERGKYEKNSKGIYYSNGNYEAFARPEKPEGVEEKNPYILDEIRKELRKVQGIKITSSWPNNIEVMNEGVDKGNAVKILAEKMNIDREDIIAFGDNYNDIEMIKFAGLGVAMGNAEELIKQEADYVTDTNQDSGVAKAIYKFLELKESLSS